MKSYRLAYLVLAISAASAANTFAFAEGYSSREPGTSAEIWYREFTIYIAKEACARSPIPTRIRVALNRPSVSIGERIHRTSASELIIEAYAEDGRFLPRVPLTVNVDAPLDVGKSRADWDYFEATGIGEVKVTATWLCGDVSGSVDFKVVK